MGSPMKIRAKVDGDLVQVKVLMAHIMETGLRVIVPLFVNQGDDLRIDTRTGAYIERA